IPVAAAWPADALDALASRPGVVVGDILAVAPSAPSGPEQAIGRLRARARAILGDSARALTPRLRWDDMVLPAPKREALVDPAFVRRLRHVVEFARPAATERRTVWRRAVAALAGERRAAELGGFLDGLADRHELTAAQIKNAALTARYAAMREGGPMTEAQI